MAKRIDTKFKQQEIEIEKSLKRLARVPGGFRKLGPLGRGELETVTALAEALKHLTDRTFSEGEYAMKVHKSITRDEVYYAMTHCSMDGVRSGFCTACGAEARGVIPTTKNKTCKECNAKKVCSAEIIYPHV